MNKETIVIKNYVLSTDMIYLNYNIEEGTNNRSHHKKISIYNAKIENTNSFKKNGKCLPKQAIPFLQRFSS